MSGTNVLGKISPSLSIAENKKGFRILPVLLGAIPCSCVSAQNVPRVIRMETHIADNQLAQLLAEITSSTARVRVMADEAHALVEQLETRTRTARVESWSDLEMTPHKPRK